MYYIQDKPVRVVKKRIDESRLVESVSEVLKKSDVFKVLEKDKDFEKKVKEITVEVLTEFFRVMYQHSNIFKTLSRK
jgi:hypothetical protein